MLQKQARTVGDSVEGREPVSQQQQEGGHPCPKSTKEVIFTVTLRSLPPHVWVDVEVICRRCWGWFEGGSPSSLCFSRKVHPWCERWSETMQRYFRCGSSRSAHNGKQKPGGISSSSLTHLGLSRWTHGGFIPGRVAAPCEDTLRKE